MSWKTFMQTQQLIKKCFIRYVHWEFALSSAIAMLLFTVTYICVNLIYIRLSRLLLEGRTDMVSAIFFFFFFFFVLFFFESHLKFYWPKKLSGIIWICRLHRLETSILVFTPPKNRIALPHPKYPVYPQPPSPTAPAPSTPQKKKKKKKICFSLPPKYYQCLSLAYLLDITNVFFPFWFLFISPF